MFILEKRLAIPFLIAFPVPVRLFESFANAEKVGHYIGGATGLENGSDPPPVSTPPISHSSIRSIH
jgi:hypothetical protein